jgi:nicotinate-nucleotide adenylyltransferase
LTTHIHFFQGVALRAGRLGIFPGAFNPVTRAHLAVARAARDQYELDQVIFLLPRNFPHKEYEGTTLEQRVMLLQAAAADDAKLAIASSQGGLFIEIAREFRAECGDGVEIHLLCGRDAAERIVHWDYGDGPPFARQLKEFQMLVASREGEYTVPAEYAARIHPIRMPPDYDEISSSAVRKAIGEGADWERLVPESVVRLIREKKLYGPQRST